MIRNLRQLTFQPYRKNQHMKQTRLMVPPRVLPDLPKKDMDLMTVNRSDYVPLSLDHKAKSYKPTQNVHISDAPFQSNTSYHTDYPTRDIERNPVHLAERPSCTIPRNVEVSPHENYITTNQMLFRKWSMDGRQEAFSEPPQHAQIFLDGKCTNTKTVSQADYTAEIHAQGKPSTSCKKAETMYQSHGKFSNATTSKSTYKLPVITDRTQPKLRKESKKNRETLEQMQGKIQNETQYRKDNPGFQMFPIPRGICPPAENSLRLFKGHFNGESEHQSNFLRYQDPPRPRTSFKKTDGTHSLSPHVKFGGRTITQIDFQPIPIEKQTSGLKEVARLGADICSTHKSGHQIKEAQNFGLQEKYATTNKSDYFQFWKTSPRVRFGDSSERAYQPSSAKFATVSEARSCFVPMKSSPAKSCKSALDFRNGDGTAHEGVGKMPMNSVTAYKQDYPVRRLPQRDICPAEIYTSTKGLMNLKLH